MTFHVFFMYPETAGRTLEEIDVVFDMDVKPWKTSQIEDTFGAEIEKKEGKINDGADATHQEVV